jgi:phosphoribosyl 1,2-cyclic phosphodiesterase
MTDTTRLIVDCGFGIKDLTQRLARRSIEPTEIDAILVTHEHGDHGSGVARVANKFNIDVYLTRGTSLHHSFDKLKQRNWIEAEQTVQIGDIECLPYTVPHDAREPVQFVFQTNGKKIGLLTDVGKSTPHIIELLDGCDLLLLEFNHDRTRLLNSRYPDSLKNRIIGDLGHLSNEQSQELLEQLTVKPKQLVALHLSEENNSEQMVSDIIESYPQINYIIAEQNDGTAWINL